MTKKRIDPLAVTGIGGPVIVWVSLNEQNKKKSDTICRKYVSVCFWKYGGGGKG